MRAGDVIGHEFMGEVVETGPEVKKVEEGRSRGRAFVHLLRQCWYCQQELWSLCDNTNPNAEMQAPLLGYPTAGIYGYTHAFGGYAGSHADYVRVPHADVDCFQVPEGLRDEQVVFLSDAAPTGYMGADFCDIQPGDTVAVWGCGGVGLMAQKSAYCSAPDASSPSIAFPNVCVAREQVGSEIINYEQVDSVLEALQEMTGGRGPDACIDAVGMEAHGTGVQYAYDRVKQALQLHTDRGEALREAIMAVPQRRDAVDPGCIRSDGQVPDRRDHEQRSDGANRAAARAELRESTARTRARREMKSSSLVTHRLPLEEAVTGYDLFKHKRDGCIRAVFAP